MPPRRTGMHNNRIIIPSEELTFAAHPVAAEGPGYGRGAEKAFPPGWGGPPGPEREVGGGEGGGRGGAPVPGRRAVRAGRAGKRNPVTDLHGGEVSQKKKKTRRIFSVKRWE